MTLSIEPINWEDCLASSDSSDSDSSSSSSESSDPSFLGRRVAQVKGYILLTLNYPRTVAFNNATSQYQKVMYCKLVDKLPTTMCGSRTTMHLKTIDAVFEHCKSGAIHYHSLIEITCDNAFSIAGLVSDYSKHIHQLLPKKYSNYLERAYIPAFQRYRVPSMCVQYKPFDDPYIPEWRTYMHKEVGYQLR